MKLDASNTVCLDEWDKTVSDLGGNVHHSSAYAHYIMEAEPNTTPLFLTLSAPNGDIVGAALGFVTRSPHRSLSRLSAKLWLATFPALKVDGGGSFLEFLDAVEDYARGAGMVTLDLQSAASAGGGEAFHARGYQLTERWEFELDLRRSEDDLWKGLEYKRRKNIKKAQRMGVTVAELFGEDGIAELRRLQHESSTRIVARGGPDIAANRKRLKDPVAELLAHGVGRIVGANVGGGIVSAGLFTYFNGLVYHTLSGHSEAALRSQAPTVLLWETIKSYRNSGATRFNLGGCSRDAVDYAHPENGVYVYKMGFGAQRIECTSARKVLRPRLYTLRESIKRILRR